MDDEGEEQIAFEEGLPGTRRALAAIVMVLINVAIDFIWWVLAVAELFLFLAGDLVPHTQLFDRLALAETILLLTKLPIFIGGAVVFSTWFYRAYANLRLWRTRNLEQSPAWAAAFLFIPVWNFYKPFQAAQEIWKASDPSASRSNWIRRQGSYLIWAWWAGWLGGTFFGMLRQILVMIVGGSHAPAGLALGVFTFFLLRLVNVATDVLLVLVIRAVMQRQAKKLQTMIVLAAHAPAP